uniref:Reductase n=1 Tax=Preussia typharum TaxID=718249 RepID=A0A8A0Y2A1_9PLEO|nr:reductase [Preussia typharum]
MASPNKVYDAIIVGGGPAGLSAALGLSRICRPSILFDSGEYRNQGSTAMHTYLTRDGIHPGEFRANGRREIESKYSAYASFVNSKIVSVERREIMPGYTGFQAVDSANKTYLGKKLVLATGSEDILPTDIEGFKENWPEHIHQCPFCDGFEHKDHPIGLLGFPSAGYAHFALMVRTLNPDVTVYSNGPVPADADTQAALKKVLATGVKLDERRVKRLVNNGEGPEKGVTVEFEDGESATVGMLMHKPPTRARAQALIQQLGLKLTPHGDVELTNAMMLGTNVPGCIVAGDTQDMMKQAIVAAGAGVRAAAVVTMQLAGEEGEEALAKQKEKENL